MRFITNTILFCTALTIVLCDRDFTTGHRVFAAVFLLGQYITIAGSLEFLTKKRQRT